MTKSGIRRGGLFPKTLKASVSEVLKPILKAHGLAETRIIQDWPRIVGERMAKRCVPFKLVTPRGKKDGTLHVHAQAGFATELPYLEPQILEQIARYFGHRAVSRLKIEQRYSL